MKFSLITGTIGEVAELEKLFASLRNQRVVFEFILVDQSGGGEVKALIGRYGDVETIYVKTDKQALSSKRNLGLHRAAGDIVCFPDADCTFPRVLLEGVEKFFRDYPDAEVLAVNVGLSKEGPLEAYLQRKEKPVGVLPKREWHYVRSVSLFLKKDVVEEVGDFDEDLGVGARFGSGEESDYVYRILQKGFKIHYSRDLYVRHELDSFAGKDPSKRAYNYGLGHGALLKKHLWYGRQIGLLPYFVRMFIRPLGGVVLGLFDRKKRSFYWNSLKGRVKGFREYSTA